MEAEVRSLLPWPLWCWIGVGIDGRRCWVVVVWHYIGFWRICWGGVLWHAVWLAVGDGVGGRGSGRRGVKEVKVERSRGSNRSGRCSRRWDPLQDNMWVKLRLGAVEPGHGGLQQTLLTPERQKHNKPSVITNKRTHMKCIHVRLRLHFKIRLKYSSKQTTGLLKHVRNYRNATTIKLPKFNLTQQMVVTQFVSECFHTVIALKCRSKQPHQDPQEEVVLVWFQMIMIHFPFFFFFYMYNTIQACSIYLYQSHVSKIKV